MRLIESGLCLLVAGLILVAGSARAQAPAAPPPTAPLDSAPGEVAPGAKPTAPAENLSKKSQSNGIIHPKEVDPGIQKAGA